MGQAKKRGTLEQRQRHAIARNKTMTALGGKDNVRKYFECVAWNKAIALRSDNGEEFTTEEAQKFGENQEFIDRYKKQFEEKYNDYISRS